MTNKNQLRVRILLFQLLGFVTVKHNGSDSGTRTGRQAAAYRSLLGFFFGVKDWEQQLLKVASLDGHQRVFGAEQFRQFVASHLIDTGRHLDRPANAGQTDSLGISCLQHVQLALFDREFHVLRVFVVLFKLCHDLQQLSTRFDEALIAFVGDFVQVKRCADTGHNVFTLCVD